jgi:hypothetical protein
MLNFWKSYHPLEIPKKIIKEPTILLVNPESFNKLTERKSGYTYIQMPSSMNGLFNISS